MKKRKSKNILNYAVLEKAIREVEKVLEGYDAEEKPLILGHVQRRIVRETAKVHQQEAAQNIIQNVSLRKLKERLFKQEGEEEEGGN